MQVVPKAAPARGKKTHYQLQLQDARRKGKKGELKEAAISVARHENKPTEKSALMSRVYAAGGLDSPSSPPKGRDE